MNFATWLKEKYGLEAEKLTPETRAIMEKIYTDIQTIEKRSAEEQTKIRAEAAAAIEKAQKEAGVSLDDKARAATREEYRKIREEEEKVRAEAATKIRAEAKDYNIPAETAERCVKEGLTVEQARQEFLKHMSREMPTGIGFPAVIARESGFGLRELEAGYVASDSGREASAVKTYGAETVEKGVRAVRSMGLLDLVRFCLSMDGRSLHQIGSRDDLIRQGFSTTTLPQLLGAVANRTLLQGYQEMPNTWSKIAKIIEVNNFQTQTVARPTFGNGMAKVGKGGKIPHGTSVEEYEQFRAYTYAEQFAITREDIINDDTGVFTQVPQALGADAAREISKQFYTHLLANGTLTDGSALFVHSGHQNYVSGTDSALSSTYGLQAIAKAMVEFRKQKNKAGANLDLRPQTLLCPPDVEGVAQSLFKSEFLVGGNTTDGTPNANVWRGMFEPIVEPRLSDTGYSGYSATAWYLFGDPNLCPVMAVGFLRGQRGPTVERFQADPSTLGMIWRAYIDFGVKSIGYLGAVKSAGV